MRISSVVCTFWLIKLNESKSWHRQRWKLFMIQISSRRQFSSFENFVTFRALPTYFFEFTDAVRLIVPHKKYVNLKMAPNRKKQNYTSQRRENDFFLAVSKQKRNRHWKWILTNSYLRDISWWYFQNPSRYFKNWESIQKRRKVIRFLDWQILQNGKSIKNEIRRSQR